MFSKSTFVDEGIKHDHCPYGTCNLTRKLDIKEKYLSQNKTKHIDADDVLFHSTLETHVLL